jgi:opacity protein-like surface antigen
MIRVAFIAFALMILTGVHHPPDVHGGDLEITPLFGYTFEGGFEDSVTGTALEVDEGQSYGIILGLRSTDTSQYELFYSHQPTKLQADGGAFTGNPLFDLDINYFHLGGTYWKESGKITPYVAGGLGVTYLKPKAVGDSETKFSLSLGGGIKFFLTEHIGLRLEGRGFGTVVGGGSIFCGRGNCAVQVSGDTFWQFSAFSGVILAF